MPTLMRFMDAQLNLGKICFCQAQRVGCSNKQDLTRWLGLASYIVINTKIRIAKGE